MKKITVLVFLLLLMVSVSACASEKKTEEITPKQKDRPSVMEKPNA